MEPNKELVFLKLGGSLITEKQRPFTSRQDVIRRLAGEIAAALQKNPRMALLLGHGSGSFGHVPAQKFGTLLGKADEDYWVGFMEVWRAAATLNRIVCDALTTVGVPALTIPPSASLIACDHHVEEWNLEPIWGALSAGIVPLVYGDVVFDRARSGTIFSTEDLFEHLAVNLQPQRILLAGIEEGVWADFPDRDILYPLLTPGMLPEVAPYLTGSSATDVTGGMVSKVRQGLRLVDMVKGLEICIFSGIQPGTVERVLSGEQAGTVLRADR